MNTHNLIETQTTILRSLLSFLSSHTHFNALPVQPQMNANAATAAARDITAEKACEAFEYLAEVFLQDSALKFAEFPKSCTFDLPLFDKHAKLW